MNLKKITSLSATVLLTALIALPLASCGKDGDEGNKKAPSDAQTLSIYNWGDYIYDGTGLEGDDENNPTPEIVVQFENYYNEKYKDQGKSVSVDYSTFDTNETMLNILETNASQYDLVCPSDYIIQKMIKNDMIEKIPNVQAKIPNYFQYSSQYLQDIFTTNNWTDYAVGYMWGTVGLTYDPEDVADIDMESWQSLWSVDYDQKIQVKDSMRDTYIVAIAKVYRQELTDLRAKWNDGTISDAEYNKQINIIFNRHDADTIAAVEKALNSLKKNIYGYEVDSGKNDVARGTVDINLAWSGDAVYSMDTAESDYDGKQLKFSVPQEGSNIWFDGWCVPKGGNVDLACEFLNFISDPTIAKQNMEFIGYTSFIAGDDMLDMVWDWYGDEEGDRTVDLSYFFNGSLSTDYDATRMIVKTSVDLNTQFDTQYPSKEVITRCAVMQDFGEENVNVVAMWERIRSNVVPTWLLIVVAVAVAGGIAAYTIVKLQRTKHRRKRRKASR